MPKVTFMPMGTVCEAKSGESILDVAINHAVPIQHACGGFCACTTCHIQVEEGAAHLHEMEQDEIDTLERADGVTQKSRLGCQAKVKSGDVVVTIMNIED